MTFMMIVRGGGPSSGYVSTGYYAGKYLTPLRFRVLNILFFVIQGLTLGRVILVEVTKKVTFYILCEQTYSLMHRLETFMLFTFIPSLRFCKVPPFVLSFCSRLT